MAEKANNLVLPDSNVYIDLLRAGRDPAEEIATLFDTLDLVTCGMVKLEVLRGAHSPKLFARLSDFFALQQFVVADNKIWDEAIALAHTLARIGVTVPAQDLVIAASAIRVDATVLTADKHFSMIPDLHVIASPFRA